MTRRAVALALAALVVVSAVPVTDLVGTASAATYTHDYNNSEELLIVDVGNYSGGFTLQVDAKSDTPSGSTTTIYDEHFNTSDGDVGRYVTIGNYGAYGNVTVEFIEDSSASGAVNFSSSDSLANVNHLVASTGGDADYKCEIGDQFAEFTSPGVHQIDCNALPGTKKVDTSTTDSTQLSQDLYQSAQNAKGQQQNFQIAVDNRLQDAQTVAMIKGKNAYIRALNNGSTKSAAKTEAKSAINDYYAVQQENYIKQYNLQILHAYNYIAEVEKNDSGITHEGRWAWDGDGYGPDSLVGAPTGTLTLANGTSITYHKITVEYTTGSGSTYQTTHDPFAGSIGNLTYNDTQSSTNTEFNYVEFPQINSTWQTTGDQANDATAQMDTFVENTYSSYADGEINNTDLMDPYVLANEHSPGSDYQGWTAAQLAALGTNSPDGFDQIGHFNLTYEDGTTDKGVLFSQENPPSGQFETNVSYDPSQINGTQWIVTADQTKEITQNFTIDDIETHDGTKRANVTIVEKQYQTANISELKQLYDELAYARAQIEAREKNLETSGGGAFFNGNTGQLVAGVAVLAGVGLLMSRKDGGSGY